MVEHEPRIEALSELLDVGSSDRLDDEHAAGRERALERSEEVALQVVDLDHDVIAPFGEGLDLEIHPAGLDGEATLVRRRSQRRHRHVGDVDGVDGEPELREAQGVASVAARDVQGSAAAEQLAILRQPL